LRDTGSGNAKAVSAADLQKLATSVGHPVFWLGQVDGDTNELTSKSNGSIIIRYLPPGVAVGAQGQYWSVATYPFPGAYAGIQRALKAGGATQIKLAHGGLAEYLNTNPNNVHAAYPGYAYQVEVFAPGGQAVALVQQGKLTSFGGPKGGAIAPKPKAASPAALKSLAGSLGHPIYWVGPKHGYTYELTQTDDGKVYVRYLPPGVAVGAKDAYLSVGTYPYANAFAETKGLLSQPGNEKVAVPGGGVAVYGKSYPQSIHLAYPGSNLQVEVFDPSAAAVRRIVSSGELHAIG